MKIVFATNSKHKSEEIEDIPGEDFEIASLAEIGCHEDIPKTGATLEENARQKSSYVVGHYGQNCFANDTGFEVEVLGGESDVRLARYAKEADHDSEANMHKLLANLEGRTNHKAYFRTIISLVVNDVEHQSEGKVEGRIAIEDHGIEGFGYGPIFIPEGHSKSFVEFGEKIKGQISYRARAVKKLAEYLGKLKG